MTTNYAAGRTVEYTACKELRRLGYHAQRTAGSHSPFDIVAWERTWVLMIQVKRVRHPTDIRLALERAIQAWEGITIPMAYLVRREAWIRCHRKWHIYDLRLPNHERGKP